ncbi:MAG: hypothetical protein ABSE06_14195 [Anaerolineaceae bacterium]
MTAGSGPHVVWSPGGIWIDLSTDHGIQLFSRSGFDNVPFHVKELAFGPANEKLALIERSHGALWA